MWMHVVYCGIWVIIIPPLFSLLWAIKINYWWWDGMVWHGMAWYGMTIPQCGWSNPTFDHGTMAHPFPIYPGSQAAYVSTRSGGGRRIWWHCGILQPQGPTNLWLVTRPNAKGTKPRIELIWLVVQSPMPQKSQSTGILFPIFCFSSGWKRLPEIEPPKRLVVNSFNSWL